MADALGGTEPAGRRWDFDEDDQVSLRLPKLAALYRLTLRPPAPGALLKRSVSTIDDT